MNVRTTLRLGRATLRSARYLLDGRVRFPEDRLGDVLELPDGDTFTVYRETALRSAADTDTDADDGVVLVFRMRVTGRRTGDALRDVLSDPLANVATPFFAGMPGFRRKLWLAGDDAGEFLELYEWETREDAERFVDVLGSLLDPFDAAGSASFEVVEDDSIDEYVAARAVAWSGADAGREWRRRRRRSVGLSLVVIACLLAGYLAWRWARGGRAGERGAGE